MKTNENPTKEQINEQILKLVYEHFTYPDPNEPMPYVDEIIKCSRGTFKTVVKLTCEYIGIQPNMKKTEAVMDEHFVGTVDHVSTDDSKLTGRESDFIKYVREAISK